MVTRPCVMVLYISRCESWVNPNLETKTRIYQLTEYSIKHAQLLISVTWRTITILC